MAISQSMCVVDTSVLIDLHMAELLKAFMQFPASLITPDVILAELHNPECAQIARHGLQEGELTGSQVLEVLQLREQHPSVSVNDLFALVLARVRQAILLTGDNNLRKAATARNVEVHGTLWILDRMIECGIITEVQAADGLERMLANGSRLPADECNKRLSNWRPE